VLCSCAGPTGGTLHRALPSGACTTRPLQNCSTSRQRYSDTVTRDIVPALRKAQVVAQLAIPLMLYSLEVGAQNNTVLYSAVQYITIHYNTLQYSTILSCISPGQLAIPLMLHSLEVGIEYKTVQYSTVQYNTAQYNTLQ